MKRNLIMAAIMVLSLAGCGGSGSTAAQARPQTAPQLQRPVPRPSAPAPTAPARLLHALVTPQGVTNF